MTVMTTATFMAGMAGKTGILMAGNVGASGTVQMVGEVGIGMATIAAVVGAVVWSRISRSKSRNSRSRISSSNNGSRSSSSSNSGSHELEGIQRGIHAILFLTS